MPSSYYEIRVSGVLPPEALLDFDRLSASVESLLRQAVTRLGLSARAYHRILKIARTIADLAGSVELSTAHVSEAIQYRSLDRKKEFASGIG